MMSNAQNRQTMREKTEPDRDTYMQRNATHSLLRIVRRTHDPNEVCTPLDYYYLRFRSFPTDEEIIDLFSCLQHVLGEHADYLEAHFGFYDPATDDPATLSFGEQLVSIHSIIVQTLQNPENPPDVVVPHEPQNYGIYPTFSEFKLRVILPGHDARWYARQVIRRHQRRMATALGSHPRLGLSSCFRSQARWQRNPY